MRNSEKFKNFWNDWRNFPLVLINEVQDTNEDSNEDSNEDNNDDIDDDGYEGR